MAGYKGHLAGGAIAATGTGMALLVTGTSLAGPNGLIPLDNAFPRFTGDLQNTASLLYYGSLAGVCLIFSLWPDADTDSKAQRIFGGFLFLLLSFLILYERFKAAAVIGLMGTLPMMAKHRGWTHTWWALLFVPLPFLLFPYYFLGPSQLYYGVPFYLSAILGYATHLLIDGHV